MTLSPGTKIGSYEIVGPIGAGGMGDVYRARNGRADGRERIFLGGTGGARMLSAVAVATTPAGLDVGTPAPLFTLAPDHLEVAPTADHTRFLTVVQPAALREPPLRLVLGWQPDKTQ